MHDLNNCGLKEVIICQSCLQEPGTYAEWMGELANKSVIIVLRN